MIAATGLELRAGAQLLLEGATFQISPGDKVGLVGRNGAGKTTLARVLAGDGLPAAGTVQRRGTIGYLPQDSRAGDLTALAMDRVLSARGLDEVRAGMRAAEEAMADSSAVRRDAAVRRYSSLEERLVVLGGYAAEAEAAAIASSLGLPDRVLTQPLRTLSGGQRRRVELARILFSDAQTLLLDEPTNHLDLDALVWLEAWLQKYPGTMIVISHDREFLDAVTDVTLHIANAQLTRYGGNYSKFEDMRALQMEQQQVAFSKQQDKIAHLQKFIDRFKAKASKAKQAQSRVKALDRMEKIAPLLAEADFTFEFKEPANLPNPMLSMQNAFFGYPPPEGAPAGRVRSNLRRAQSRPTAAHKTGRDRPRRDGESAFRKVRRATRRACR